MSIVGGLVFAVVVLPHVSALTVQWTENDYSGSRLDGYISVAVLWTGGTISSNITLRVTPMTYTQYNSQNSNSLALPTGCYPADSSDFNNSPLLVFISPSTPTLPIKLNVGIFNKNESERQECFLIVLSVADGGHTTVIVSMGVSIMSIDSIYPFTVSFEKQTVTVNEDVGTIEVYVVKDNNQKVGYNFTLMLQDLTPYTSPLIQAGVDYVVEQLAVLFPTDKQRVPVVIRIIDVNVSKDDEILNLHIFPSYGDYSAGQSPSVIVNIINNNYVTVKLEDATYWLMVCLSVEDPIFVRRIIFNIQAYNLTDQGQALEPFYSGTVQLSSSTRMDCVNVTENDYLYTFLVTVSTLSSRVLILPNTTIRDNLGPAPYTSSLVKPTIEPAPTGSPFVKPYDFSWWIILVITTACCASCCLCCWLLVGLCACLFGKEQRNDERYNEWRCGVIEVVQLEEYKIAQ